MKLFFTILISFFCLIFFTNKPNEIPITIHFENPKNLPFEKGILQISGIEKSFQINSLENITVDLKKGKHTFTFQKDGIPNSTKTIRISKKNNYIVIQLRENIFFNIENSIGIPEENTENLLKNKNATFINFGLEMQDFTDFKKKYGIGNKNQGCVISGSLGKRATKNNQLIAEYLDKKYGKIWREDLPFLPYGLEGNN